MPTPNTEMTEVTKLVLYGWGYPDLFNSQAGTPLQNRLVKFSVKALPVIEAASQDALLQILPKLEMIRSTYLDRLNQQDAGIQPLWVWVDRPERLSSSEIMSHRKKFEDWVETVAIPTADRIQGSSSLVARFLTKFQVQPLQSSLTRWFIAGWKQRAIAIAIGAAIVLVVIRVFLPTLGDPTVGLMVSESSVGVEKIIP
jgi:hypothetical protein